MKENAVSEKSKQSEYLSQDSAVLMYVLRGITSQENALSAPNLAREMRFFLGSYSERTLKRLIDKLLAIQNWQEEKDAKKRREKAAIAEVLYCVYGGRILTCGEKNLKYYFEPCLDDASMRMLNGTVISNRFLSEDEKRYLLTRMRLLNMLGGSLLNPDYDEEGRGEETSAVADMPDDEEESSPFPGEANTYLRNIVQIEQAISENTQITITYGIYDYDERYGIDFRPRTQGNEVKQYDLNPFALLWNGGHYYLLATYAKDTAPDYLKDTGSPVHFRVDRIIDVMPRMKKHQFIRREGLPSTLKPYFGQDLENRLYLKEELYCARFPAMRISKEKELINAVIECTPWSLQILVDAFGSALAVKKSRRKHAEAELDYYGREQMFLEAKIEKVNFENMVDFCLANPEYLTPLEPRTLVRAVKGKLEEACERLK